ncbi:MAG: tyrosine-type recombinase/integrase [Chloroflexota bacterium]|nr:tyrosine-type recombinase/integrase [Chloroflexota bacterium]
MAAIRQLPLFPTLPTKPEEITHKTALKHTLELFHQHLMKEGKTQHTVKAFASDLHLMAEYLGEDKPVGEFTTTNLNEFLRWMEVGRGVPCSRKTYARRVTTLKVYFKWLTGLNAIPFDPAVPVLQRSGQAPLSDILEEDEISLALSFTYTLRIAEKPDARPALLLRLLLETGIKKSETERLLLRDIVRLSKHEAVLTIRHSSPKDLYKERRMPLSADFLDVMDEYVPQYRLKETLFNCTTRNLEYILEDVGKGAGLEKKPSFEMLRWTCALRDYRAGMDAEAIREKLGLSKISWVETFAKIRRLAGEQEEES